MRTKQSDGIERRDMLVQDLELRVDGDTGAPTVEGYAAVFDSLSDVLFEWDSGRFRERIKPGAFARSLREQNVQLLVEHADLPLATTAARTLELKEDDHGLYFRSVLDASDPDVQRLIPKMRRGDMNKCSFGFVPMRDRWDETTKPRTRILQDVKLIDVSIVARPAYPATEAKVRRILAEDGLDAEGIAELLVRIRQGLPLEDDDVLTMRRMVEICQRQLQDTAAEQEAAQDPLVHPVESNPQAQETSAQDPVVHPLSWYREQLAQMGV